MKQDKRSRALSKELQLVQKQEKKLETAAGEAKTAVWKEYLEKYASGNQVYRGLEAAFCKGFAQVFERGEALFEKGGRKESLKADYTIRDYAVQVKGGRKELRQMRKSAGRSDLFKAAVATVEGVGLGALGIGVPDIVLFLGVLMSGVYEAALNYGVDYNAPTERMLILKMMEAALSKGEMWNEKNRNVDELLFSGGSTVTEEMLQEQIHSTASVFAADILLMKFIQGIPVVGIIGGAANLVYYRKVMDYVQLKYRKRYLCNQANSKLENQ